MRKKGVFNMKRWQKVVLLVILAVIFLYGLSNIINHDYNTAQSPKSIASEAGWKLPDYKVVNQSDNMERDASAWSSYYWTVKLNEPLTGKQIAELDDLVKRDSNWSANKDGYSYQLEDDERDISININVKDGKVDLEYMWYDMLS